MKILTNKAEWSNTLQIAIVDERNGVRYVAQPLTMEKVDENSFIAQPTLELDVGSLQAFIDSLWEQGHRPTQTKGTKGELESVRYHLEDMRKLVLSPQDAEGE